MKFLIATFNRGKQEEYRRILIYLARENHIDLELVFPQDLKIEDNVEETGKTFEENAILKAEHFFKKIGLVTIADDGGIEIEALGGAPGVKSRRWLGRKGSDKELIDTTLKKLKKLTYVKDRKATFRVAITYFDGKKILTESDKIEGYIASHPSPIFPEGYPYRGLFVILPLNKYYDDLSAEEHKIYNHREKALARLWKRIVKLYNE